MRRGWKREQISADVPVCCQLLDRCAGIPVAHVELSGLVNPNITFGEVTTIRHWSGDVCESCLQILYNEQIRYARTASMRITRLGDELSPPTVVGNGRVFESNTLLAQLHPALQQIKAWERPVATGAEAESVVLSRDGLEKEVTDGQAAVTNNAAAETADAATASDATTRLETAPQAAPLPSFAQESE